MFSLLLHFILETQLHNIPSLEAVRRENPFLEAGIAACPETPWNSGGCLTPISAPTSDSAFIDQQLAQGIKPAVLWEMRAAQQQFGLGSKFIQTAACVCFAAAPQQITTGIFHVSRAFPDGF